MQKKAIISILLTFAVIVLWSLIQAQFFPQAPSKPQPQEVRKEEASPQEKVSEKKTEIRESKPLKEVKTPAKAKAVPPKEVSIETQNYWAVFTSEDARLKHFRLKNYEDRVEESALTVTLVQFFQELFSKKEEPKKPVPLDLVNTSEEAGLPLGMNFITPLPSSTDENWEVEK